jgi:hypothetical protein
MAVPEGPTEKRYAANGVTTVFTIPFLLLASSDLKVYLNDLEVTSGFTLTGVGLPQSTITFSSAPSGTLLLQLNVPFQRLNDYQENGDFLSSTVNRDFDRIWQALKQLLRYSTRSLSLGFFDVDGNGFYRAKGNGIINLASANEVDNAATNWKDVKDLVAEVLLTGQGPVNNAANVIYVGPYNDVRTVQDLSNIANPYLGSALLGRQPLQINTVAELRATPGRFNGDRAFLKNYLASDKKGRRFLTWVTGASADDAGMKFAATGGTWFSDLNEDGRVCSEFYGLPLAAGVSCIVQDAAIEAYCYANKVSAWYGPGPDQTQWPAIYDYGVNNWSWSGARIAAQALKDYQGVRIYSCPSVTFKTSSALGADVMQCCGIKNFGVIGFPKVTATLSGSSGSGSNALSLVFGAVDCVFELDIHDMPGIYKADGSIDGGQGFSVQPGTGNTNPYKNVRLIGSVDGATQGFGCDFALDDQVALPLTGIRLDLSIRNCYRGVAIGGAAATVAHTPKAYTGITGSVRIENCQQSFVNLRSVGTNLDIEVVNTLPKASLVKHAFNSSVIVSMILAAKDGGARITGRVLTVDTVLQIGGTTMGGGDFGTTENFTLVHSVSFTGATNQVVVTDSGGNAVDKSDVSLLNLTAGYADLSIKGGNTVKVDGAIIAPTSYPGDTTITSVRSPKFTAIYAAVLTAVRAVNFVSSPRAGDVVRVVRLASATGGGVSVGGLTNILAGTWAEATYSGSAWAITGQGSV